MVNNRTPSWRCAVTCAHPVRRGKECAMAGRARLYADRILANPHPVTGAVEDRKGRPEGGQVERPR